MQVQQLLVMDRFSSLAAFLHGWLISQQSVESVEGLQHRSSSAGGATGGEAGGSEQLQGVSGLPSRHLRMVAFGTHLLLLLEGLGVTASKDGAEMEPARSDGWSHLHMLKAIMRSSSSCLESSSWTVLYHGLCALYHCCIMDCVISGSLRTISLLYHGLCYIRVSVHYIIVVSWTVLYQGLCALC
jgi:hypothetical protein